MTSPLRSSSRRRTTAASAVLLLGLALTACGGSDDEAGDDTSPRASESTSEASESSEPTPTEDTPVEPTTSPTEAAPALPSEEELSAVLLTADEVPAGFTAVPDDGEGDDGDNPFEGTCLADVGEFSEALGAEPDEEAEAEYGAETATTQASVDAKVQAYADPAVGDVFAAFTDELQSCTSVQASAEGVDYDFDISYDDTVDLPGAEDQLAFDVTGTIGAGEQVYPVTYRFVVSLTGQLVSVVGVFALGDDASGVLDTAKDLATVQAERVATLG